MAELTMVDVVAASYELSPDGLEHLPAPTKKNTALLLVDIQGLATPDYLAKKAVAKGLPEDQVTAALADYRERFDAALANCARVLSAARKNNILPIHVKIETRAIDARDAGLGHKLLDWRVVPGSDGARFLDECAPKPGEMVITKTASSAFIGTGLHQTLSNMGIRVLYVAGFVADECVETTVRVGIDLGYFTNLISDATTTYYEKNHRHVVDKFTEWGITITAQQVSEIFESLT
ncbi:MAG: cysteine hydrolase [Deltaproteobacteria bacterium]|nr:cysteine hydrolase [Candidatus Zymogenaceae bacterium]